MHLIRHLPPIALAIVVCMSTLAADAEATVMRYADVDRLVEISDLVVYGVVTDRRIVDDGDVPWTDTDIAVGHVFLGDRRTRITFHQWGADDGKKRGRIAGDPRLEPGQEVVLFLRIDEQRGGYALAALGQAVFEVRDNGDQRLVHRDLEDLSFLLTADDKTRIIHHRDVAHEWSIFVATIEELISGREDER